MTAAPPLVTIVTPTWNQGRFIGETIRSVRAQTYPAIEHLVIDGGSTDETLSILRGYGDRPGFRWISEPDSGMYDAAAKGFELARGDIFAYLNSDDLYMPWSVEAAVDAIRAGADLVYGDALLMDDATGILQPHLQLPFRRNFLLSIGSFAQPATWWTRELYVRSGGLDRALRSAGDLDLYLRATAVGRTVHLEEFLAIMRLHPSMQTVANSERIRQENVEVRRRAIASRDSDLSGARRAPIVMVERARAWAMRRVAWLRLLRATGRRARPDAPWSRFRSENRVRVHLWRVLLGQLPVVGTRFLRGAFAVDRPVWEAYRDVIAPISSSRESSDEDGASVS